MKKQRRKFIKDTALLAGASLIPIHYSFNNDSFNYTKAPFEDLDTLKVCSMNIFKKSHSFTYEKYLLKIENAILH